MKIIYEKKRVVICGPSASGKDYLMNELESKGFNVAVKHTTRPQRINEIDGVTYNYITNNVFDDLILNNKMFCYQEFTIKNKRWMYGLSNQEVEDCDVLMLTPEESKSIPKDTRNMFTVVYLYIDIYERYKRLCKRSDGNDDILRRIHSDEWDFRNFKDFDIQIKDSQFKVDDIIDLIYNKKDNI